MSLAIKPITEEEVFNIEDFLYSRLPDEDISINTIREYKDDMEEGRVYYEDGNIVGVVLFGISNLELDIRYIASTGFGRVIVEDLTTLCKESGCKYITTLSLDSASGFYKKMGFEALEERGSFIKYL